MAGEALTTTLDFNRSSNAALLAAVAERYKAPKVIGRYTGYIESFSGKGLPAILSFSHLASMLGMDGAKLHAISFATHLFYREFSIPKKSGGSRRILAPTPILDIAQRWVLKHVLTTGYPTVEECVSAYAKGKSILTHVRPHVEAEQLVKLDFKDFFPSISTHQIFRVFNDLGYTGAVSRTLAALMTVNGRLPQGAATSPLLSNIVLGEFDVATSTLCSERGLAYTRYADDLVFSGKDVSHIASAVDELAESFGFRLNHQKTKHYDSKAEPRHVTGLLLINGEVRLPKEMRRRIRMQSHIFIKNLHSIIDGGQDAFTTEGKSNIHHRDKVDDLLFADRIIGRLKYWSWVEKDHPYPKIALNKIDAILRMRLQ
ncbi:reverse transcriptase family protein [Paucibacter sp. DJ2R-2]|uniref:reverse transcriptase family protein n=1 Tax=Paucibacter sp. DJ2R-2 TaxID=2893558 RepID=UPI0021E4CBA1|nr:reverse transcriptase family protein [Paucibacter sp. DJ2R-2]MCV2421337.1 reverse transcriptase family protein [Paucibacter sp. DJ4R-1]MCV2441208.1 reverse transcriptase family protein [Paucibacter sp. DJ2R-2]